MRHSQTAASTSEANVGTESFFLETTSWAMKGKDTRLTKTKSNNIIINTSIYTHWRHAPIYHKLESFVSLVSSFLHSCNNAVDVAAHPTLLAFKVLRDARNRHRYMPTQWSGVHIAEGRGIVHKRGNPARKCKRYRVSPTYWHRLSGFRGGALSIV